MEEWKKAEHVLAYLEKADHIPHRKEGESVLLEEIPPNAKRVLDLGSGDGRLLSLVLTRAPGARGMALDYSPTMLERLKELFADNKNRIEIIEHNLEEPLPGSLGFFDAIVSSFAIHHLGHDRKKSLYQEVYDILEPGGIFCNLEHVASPTEQLHEKFLEILGTNPSEEDPSNKLLDVESQLLWLREIGFKDVDCHWKWRELALLAGRKARHNR